MNKQTEHQLSMVLQGNYGFFSRQADALWRIIDGLQEDQKLEAFLFVLQNYGRPGDQTPEDKLPIGVGVDNNTWAASTEKIANELRELCMPLINNDASAEVMAGELWKFVTAKIRQGIDRRIVLGVILKSPVAPYHPFAAKHLVLKKDESLPEVAEIFDMVAQVHNLMVRDLTSGQKHAAIASLISEAGPKKGGALLRELLDARPGIDAHIKIASLEDLTGKLPDEVREAITSQLKCIMMDCSDPECMIHGHNKGDQKTVH